jgi:hypothetical protein
VKPYEIMKYDTALFPFRELISEGFDLNHEGASPPPIPLQDRDQLLAKMYDTFRSENFLSVYEAFCVTLGKDVFVG